jgi:DNA-binding MarR family transcriptional regulator
MTILAPSASERTHTDDEALDLALAIAHPTRPRPFLIDAANNHAGTVANVREAHTLGTAYAVTVAPDVIALDLDDEHQAAALDALHAEVTAEGWPALRVASGRAGHRHLFAVVPDELARSRIAHRVDALGLPPTRTVIRPPLAPHRLGLAVEVLDDPAAFTLAAVAARAGTDRPERLDWRALLKSGRWPRGWTGEGSPSSMTWLVCIGAIRAGHDLDTVRAWLADEHNAGGTAYRRRLGMAGKRHADCWLARYVWPSALEAAAKRVDPPADAVEARERLCSLAEAIEAHRWTGIGGATDRTILRALVARGMARGSLTPAMSYRELAEAAAVTTTTVTRATRRLRAAGWLLIAKQGRGSTERDDDKAKREVALATTWRLVPRARASHTGGYTPASTSLSVIGTRAALDACCWRGLGLNAPRILDALAGGPRTAAELAELLNLDVGNLRARLLKKLAQHGLISRTPAGWELAEDLDAAMTAAAATLGLTGRADEVAAQHRRERADYLDHRERLRGRRDQARAKAIAAVADADVMARRAATTSTPDVLPFGPFGEKSQESQALPARTRAPLTEKRRERSPAPPPPISQEALDASLAVAGGANAHH